MNARPERAPRPGRLRTLSRSGAVVSLLIAASTLSTAQDLTKAPRDVVYVQSNVPSGNAILAYHRAADGGLTPLAGSPFATRGAGISSTFELGPYDSDQEIVANPSRTLLFATNGGSDTIAVFKIAADGSLAHVPGSPFASGGSNPVSLGLSGDVLCVVNKDDDPDHPGRYLPNYTSFRVTPAGRLIPVPRSTIFEPLGSDPTQALIAPGGSLVFGADFLGGLLRSFAILPGGRLVPRATLPLPASQFAGTGAPPLPLGLAAHPSRVILYVGFVTVNRIGVYRYGADGSLRFVRSVPDSGAAVCWLRVNKAGTRLYASNTGDPSISVYDISRDATMPIEIQKVNLRSAPGSNPGGYQFELDPTESFLQVVSQQFAASSTTEANALHVFRIGPDGRVTEVPGSPTVLPVPSLTRPQGVLSF